MLWFVRLACSIHLNVFPLSSWRCPHRLIFTMAAVKLTGPVENTQAMLGLHDKKGVKPDHEDVVIISIDLEFRALGGGFPVLEVGVATFDTRDVYALDPTTNDDFAYIKHITAKHFRFIESGHIQNTARWLAACYNNPDGFLYGHTEWISRDQLEFVLLSLLRILIRAIPAPSEKCK